MYLQQKIKEQFVQNNCCKFNIKVYILKNLLLKKRHKKTVLLNNKTAIFKLAVAEGLEPSIIIKDRQNQNLLGYHYPTPLFSIMII